MPSTASASSGASSRVTDAVGRAHARIGLLGNPSDLYGGKVLAATIDTFQTTATLRSAPGPVAHTGVAPELQRLVVERLAPGSTDYAVEVSTTVPFQSGLSGSSAILLAVAQAVNTHLGLRSEPLELARLAWDIERDELGIVAGPQDRVIQALGGCRLLDFSGPHELGTATTVDPALLPELLIAWPREAGTPSGDVHRPVWERWQAGDAALRARMAGFADLADEGVEALSRGDHAAFADALDANFELRASIFDLDDEQTRLVTTARAAGAAAKFCGSGGAIVAQARPGSDLADVVAALEETASVRQLKATWVRVVRVCTAVVASYAPLNPNAPLKACPKPPLCHVSHVGQANAAASYLEPR